MDKKHSVTATLFMTLFLLFPSLTAAQESIRPSENATDYDAALIPIEGDIDTFQVVFLRRSIEKAKKAGAERIIFSINTFGGRVDSALQMATLIGALRDIETIAFVPAEPESVGVSWSAGALISFSSQKIYMAPGTSIGAAAPVYQTSEGMQAAGEKTVSAVRTQLAAIAEKNGHAPEVAVAMVDKDVELSALPREGGYDFFLRDGSSGSEEGPEEEGRIIISPAGKLLSLTAGEMERYGISSGTVSTVDELQDELEIENLLKVEPSSADRVISLITSATVTSLLLMVGLVALYMEISSPGFGIPGTLALVAFALLFLSSGLMGTLNSVELLLFLAGIVLLVVEVFLIPGFGIAGITGLVFMTAGLVLSRQGFFLPDTDWQWEIFSRNLLLVFGTLTASFLLMAVLMIFFPRIKVFRRLILTGSSPPLPAAGSSSLSDPIAEGSREQPLPYTSGSLVGRTGTVLTTLRPSGKILIEDERLPVVTDGRWIEAGKKVIISSVEGNRVVVEEVEESGEAKE